ncbi:MAG: peptidyl-tRNA hydrolase [Candidatus Iainarchaeum archaeon]|uniref:Peptidyl-tRNA hydrolase n=1 Tax=Candidatus Iainarchaeum sp. TaxID=3101447 RepID=A0A497JIB4_9ARCH|nr:MAG: peptidyl-tRNA hydrolase [Candidatus Diapherotrites archaeon]
MLKQVIIVRADLKLGKGKLAAQVAHASLEAFLKVQKKFPDIVKKWLNSGAKKIVLKVSNEKELLALYRKMRRKIPSALIRDAGLTQLKPGTITCFASGPYDEKILNKYVGTLKLL